MEDISTSLSQIDRSTTQNINKEIEPNLPISGYNIYSMFHPTTKYTFFSAAHRTFSKIDHITDYKAYLGWV